MATARGAKSAEKHQTTNNAGTNAATNGTAGAGATGVLIDLDFVKQLIEAVDTSGIDTLEIARAGTRIRISKSPIPVAAHTASAAAASPLAAAPVTAPPVEPAPAPSPSRNWLEVRSPMVGTFYRAPAPEAPAYVEVGTSVTQGQTLCILEAMKLMNELESEVEGIVREILVENADPVEYGQVLFRIEPAA
jgi:acetyl-CoA carboxylase biotin carboxyl carrier protein